MSTNPWTGGTNVSPEHTELHQVIYGYFGPDAAINKYKSPDQQDHELTDVILAAGYRKPQQVATEEELETLPTGSVVLSSSYTGQSGQQIAFQRWDDGAWHRGGRSGSTHPDNFLPATIIHKAA